MANSARHILRTLSIAITISCVVCVFLFRKTIFPIVYQDEYYEVKYRVDKNISYIIIHNSNCPLGKSKWCRIKENKYDILIKRDAEFCSECFDEFEVEKLKLIHKFNYRDLYLRYRAHYTKEETDSLMKNYEYY